jgi:hypothetical protein
LPLLLTAFYYLGYTKKSAEISGFQHVAPTLRDERQVGRASKEKK